MFLLFVFFIIELIVLFFLSRRVTRGIFLTVYRLFHSRSVGVSFITLLLFPGTVIHELSHLFVAEILGVRTGKLNLTPPSIDSDEIQMGSVELAHTDPFRRSVIGIAPFLVGLIGLIGLSSVLPTLWSETLISYNNGLLFSSVSLYLCLFVIYLLFAISNTMFASAEDMKGVIPLTLVLGLLGGAIYMAGFRIGITGTLEQTLQGILQAIAKSLGVVMGINAFLLLISTLFIRFMRKGSVRVR